MSILPFKEVESQQSDAGMAIKHSVPFRRELITQTRKGLRKIESKKALSFVLKDTSSSNTVDHRLATSKAPTTLIKLFSFEVDAQIEDSYRKLDAKTCLQATNTSLAEMKAETNIRSAIEPPKLVPDSPKTGVFEVSNSPTSRHKAALGTPRFSTLAADRHHIFNRPMKIKVMINRTQSEESRSMPRIWGRPDSPLQSKLGSTLKLQTSPSEGPKRIFPFVRVMSQSSSPQNAPTTQSGQRKSFLLRGWQERTPSYKTASPSTPSLQSSKSSSKSIGGGLRGLQSGTRTHNVSPLAKRVQPVSTGPNQPLVSAIDIQQIIRKQRLQDCDLPRQPTPQKPEFEVSVDMKKKLGPFFFKKR